MALAAGKKYNRKPKGELSLVHNGGGNNWSLVSRKKGTYGIDQTLFYGTKKQCEDVRKTIGRYEDSKRNFSYSGFNFFSGKHSK